MDVRAKVSEASCTVALGRRITRCCQGYRYFVTKKVVDRDAEVLSELYDNPE